MPQNAAAAGGAMPAAAGGGARSRVKSEAQPIRPSQDGGKTSNNYGINGTNGEGQVRQTHQIISQVDFY